MTTVMTCLSNIVLLIISWWCSLLAALPIESRANTNATTLGPTSRQQTLPWALFGASPGKPLRERLVGMLHDGVDPFATFVAPIDMQYKPSPHSHLRLELVSWILNFIDTGRPAKYLQANNGADKELLIIEVGSFWGASAITQSRALKRSGKKGAVLCIDPFSGDAAMWSNVLGPPRLGQRAFLRGNFLNIGGGRPRIFDQFMINVNSSGVSDVIVPMVATGIVGMAAVQRLQLFSKLEGASLLYLDSAHEADETYFELTRAWGLLRPGGFLSVRSS